MLKRIFYTNLEIYEIRYTLNDTDEEKSNQDFFNISKEEWDNIKGDEGTKLFSYRGEKYNKGYFLIGIYMAENNLEEILVLCK